MIEENKKKKVIISTILVGIFLLVLLIGATYAYFSIDMGSSSTSTKISIETGKLNSIAITNKIPNIHINLTASDMSSTSTIKEFYATDNKDLPYVGEQDRMLDIAEISVVGNVDVRNFCSADVIVSLTNGDTMGAFLQPGDSELYIEAGDLKVDTLDLSTIKEARTKKYTANFEVMGSDSHAIKSYLKINNREDYQSDLAGKELHLSIEIKNFSCTTDTKAPTIAKFYLKEDKEEPKYTNNKNIDAYLSWLDEDVKEYCITKENTNKDCAWDSITNSNNITKQIELDNEEKEYTYSAYLKDKANNISDVLSDSITLDTTPPSITNVTSTEITTTTIGVKVTGNDTNGIDKYCYGTNQDSYTCTENNTYTFDNLNAGQEYTFYFYIIDKAGNDNKANATEKKFTTIKTAKDITSPNLETEAELAARNETITGDVKDDLRRFTGTKDEVTDNFICFGTLDQQECKDNMDLYMYRIIGIDTGGRLKLIKATKLVQGSSNTSYFAWHNTNTRDITWPGADLYKRLNGTSTNTSSYPNIFIGNEKYPYMQDTKWTDLISSTKYYIGDSTSSSNPTVYQNERTKSIENAKIGLMYLSDYLYAGSNNNTNWLFIQNGLNGKTNTPTGSIAPTTEYDWTMTRYGKSDGLFRAWFVHNSGTVVWNFLYNANAVRPVFYLESGRKIGGAGDIDNPYIVYG